jgi:hypothetical protein
MSDEVAWTVLGSFNTGLEVDIVRQTMEAEDIPVLVKGNYAGIFGAAFQGSITGGVEVLVPEAELERARALLDEMDG